MPTVAPYGSWKSPITSETLTADTVRLGDIVVDGRDVFWVESRPSEGGRMVVVRAGEDGTLSDMVPAPWNARTRAHEYGGGSFSARGGRLLFSNDGDGRLYQVDGNGTPQPLTEEAPLRYADIDWDPNRPRIACVREDHRDGSANPANEIVAIDLATGAQQVLVSGSDFVASPRFDRSGSRLCWLAWNHPNMPWDGCELWVADVQVDGTLANARVVAGGPGESIFQPGWCENGDIVFVSDRSGWWNLYRQGPSGTCALLPEESEFGLPMWVFGMSTWDFTGPEEIVCASTSMGSWQLRRLDLRTLEATRIPLPSRDFDHVRASGSLVAFTAGSPVEGEAVVRLDLESGRIDILRRSSAVELPRPIISTPGLVEFPTSGDRTAYGFYYPPTNPDFTGPPGELPPLVVLSHGGPTSQTSTTLSPRTQYWTSRGFAVLDVDYGGSTGYGRAYRERLNDNWGIVDVDDCVHGALHLADEGFVDRNRMVIRGWSASGYTTLAALAFRDVFAAGASHYGISDLAAMASDTHKFESRYLDRLVGPYPQREDIYRERSPIHFVDQISCPLIIFQGMEDRVVPPNQAEMMRQAVEAQGLPVACVMFPGEQHGFRRAESIQRAHDAELWFLGQVFGFEPADEIEPVEIVNHPGA